MTKENVLFSIIGLLLGLIIGFIATNSINQSGGTAARPPATASRPATTTQSSDLPPDHPQVASNDVAEPQQMPPAAVTETIEQARNEPNNFDAQMKAAQLYYQIRRYDEAVEFLLRANQLRPDSYEAVVALGNSYLNSNRYKEAEQWYTAALIKNPSDTDVRTYLGISFLSRTPPEVDRAIKEFRRALELDQKHEPSLEMLTRALIRKGDAKEAQATFDKLQAVSTDKTALDDLRSELEKSSSSKPPAPNKKAGK